MPAGLAVPIQHDEGFPRVCGHVFEGQEPLHGRVLLLLRVLPSVAAALAVRVRGGCGVVC